MHATKCTVEIDLINEAEWSAALDLFEDANIYQTWPYGSVRWGHNNLSHLVLKGSANIIGMAQLRIVRPIGLRLGIAYLRWGPLFHQKGQMLDAALVRRMAAALYEEYVVKRGLFLRIMPNAEVGTCRAQLFASAFRQFKTEPFSAGDSYRTFVVDLTPSLPDIRKKLDQKWRNQLNRAEKNGLEVIEGAGPEQFQTMQDVFEEMWQRKRFKTSSSIREFAQVQQHLPPHQKMKVMICLNQGRPVSAMIATAMGNSGIYLFGGTTDEGLSLKGSYLLQWRTIQWLKESGVNYYNLGGINPVTNPGVYHFKKGMSGSDLLYLEPMSACINPLSEAFARIGIVARQGLRQGMKQFLQPKPPSATVASLR